MPWASRLGVLVDDQLDRRVRPRPCRAAHTCRGTSTSYRRAAAGTAAAREERLFRKVQHHRLNPCRSNRASPASRPRRPSRAGCRCSRPRAGRDGSVGAVRSAFRCGALPACPREGKRSRTVHFRVSRLQPMKRKAYAWRSPSDQKPVPRARRPDVDPRFHGGGPNAAGAQAGLACRFHQEARRAFARDRLQSRRQYGARPS